MAVLSDLKWVGSTLYATFWNKGVFLSRDGGDSWASINEGLNETNATSIGTDGTAVYVSTFHSVFQWGENEGQWKLIGAPALPSGIVSGARRFSLRGNVWRRCA